MMESMHLKLFEVAQCIMDVEMVYMILWKFLGKINKVIKELIMGDCWNTRKRSMTNEKELIFGVYGLI